MAATVTMPRMPFGELSSSRVQQLSSAKNRQNGYLAKSSPLSGKPMTTSLSPAKTSNKRSFTPSAYDDVDSENADPSLFSPAKKSKSDASDSHFTFTMTPVKSMPPPCLPARTPVRANTSSPRAPLTAPAGRSPPRKHAGISKSRRVSAPFTRIDPPFSSRGSSSLPFSLDAAINGSMAATSTLTKEKSAGSTIQESMPASWDFEIYEDSPEEEAANLMEHSTQTLDLASDEETTKAKRQYRGKENEAPEGYDAPTASRVVTDSSDSPLPAPSRVHKTEFVRRKITEMDDGERSPLSDLETDEFIPEGVAKDAFVVVEASPEKTKLDINSLFAVSPPVYPSSASKKEGKKSSKLSITSSMSGQDSEGENVVIWEDDSEAKAEQTTEAAAETAEAVKEELVEVEVTAE